MRKSIFVRRSFSISFEGVLIAKLFISMGLNRVKWGGMGIYEDGKGGKWEDYFIFRGMPATVR